MRYRRLGTSDLEVSEIGLGSWLAYGYGASRTTGEAEEARRTVDRAFELGVTFFDTANIYSYGVGEQFLGEALQGRPRDSYVLATKLGLAMPDGDSGLSRAQVFTQIEASLARLGTDYVDLYQCHRADPETPLEETMDALGELVRHGKVRYLGFSEWPRSTLETAFGLPGMERFVSSQPQYSLLWRGPEEWLIPLCAASGISQVVWAPLAQGILAGVFPPGDPAPAGTRAVGVERNQLLERFLHDELLGRVQRLRPIADDLGITMAHLALAWVLREPNVACAITGAGTVPVLEENAAASGIQLDADTLRRIDDALGDVAFRETPG